MKTAWVLPGGGSNCSYTAGAVLALRKLGFKDPEIMIASSGSTGTAAYYVAGHYEGIKENWTNNIATKRFGNPLRPWKYMDVDYLIDHIMKIQSPLDIEKVYHSKTLLLVPLTESLNGGIRYFSQRDGLDFFEIMRASKSAPVFSGIFEDKVLKVDGKRYFDTKVSSRPPENIKKAIELGASKIIVFDNYHPNSSWTNSKYWYRLWLLTRSKEFKKCHIDMLSDESSPNYESAEIIYLKPQKPLGLSALNNDKAKLTRAFNQGFEETLSNQEIKKRLGQY